MAQFDDLPPEIVDCIVSSISHQKRNTLSADTVTYEELVQITSSTKENSSTLLNLCLTSKKIRTLTEPHLYQSWGTQRFQASGVEWNDTQQRSLQRFLLTIILRPELANHVKYIIAFRWRTRKPLGDDNLLMGPDQELFNEVAKEVDMPDHGRWSSSLKAGSADPLIALLLTLTPNLRGIFFVVPEGSWWPRAVLALAVSGPLAPDAHDFANLRQIIFTGGTPVFNFNDILPFFFLPSMQSVITIGCRDPHGPLGLEENRKRIYYPLPKGTSEITNLSLEHSEFKPRIMEGIVRACRALETLSVSYALRGFPDPNEYPDIYSALAIFEPRKLGEAVSSAKHSLRNLKLHVASFANHNYLTISQGDPVIQPIGCLRSFERLSTLDIGLVILLGNDESSASLLADVLPASLESLRLRDDSLSYIYWTIGGLITHLGALAVDGPVRLPRLKSVDVSEFDEMLFGYWKGDWDVEENELESAFRKASIELIGWW